eukprot:GHVT01043417.1.p1 GENE.GHVT01043417.1~~GHVT01043417.1.p1  ORF type:complete len:149 (-),score=35.70 GHVT01043417.1:1551-1997(-)
MWQSLRKCELKLSAVLPPSLRSPAVPLQYLRLGNDPTGMDPTAGWVVQVDELKAQLPRYCRAAEPPHTATLFATQSFEGASPRKATSSKRLRGENGFQVLKGVVTKMKLKVPDQDVKRIFDLMDVNQDLTLSLAELIGGFEVRPTHVP